MTDDLPIIERASDTALNIAKREPRRAAYVPVTGGTTLDVVDASQGAADGTWLVGGGAMGDLIRTMDWSRSPLGRMDGWPQSLRTTVGLCLASNFPINIAWGPAGTQLYNDGYRVICGSAHPRTMGQSFQETWASAWPSIGEPFERALAGETSFLENVRMYLERNGYLEETFFTFSFSPIRDESGGVGGLFHPVIETTSAMLAQRRARALRDLATGVGDATSPRDAMARAGAVLAAFDLDLPFVLLYGVEGGDAVLTGSAGLAVETAATQARIAVDEADVAASHSAGAPTWPVAAVVRGGAAVDLIDASAILGTLSCGPYPEPPTRALALPLVLPGVDRPAGVMIMGLSPRLPTTEEYRGFCTQAAATVSAALASASAHEERRRRAEALAELAHAKTAFFTNVSHELRTPLTLILGPLENLLRDGVTMPAEAHETVALALRNALRLLRLVNTLLDFSRLEAGRAEAAYVPTDLPALTAELASAFRSGVERAGLRLVVEAPPLPVDQAGNATVMYVDSDMWEKIVFNLLSNALKHTFAGEIRVTVRAVPGESAVELEVRDSGVGIAADELPRLFERFHRGSSTRSRTHEGTGIGLALVRELVHLHGGEVRVESIVGAGSVFTVRLPGGAAHLPVERVNATRTLDSTADRAGAYLDEMVRWLPGADNDADETASRAVELNRRGHVLFADDNADMREYVSRLLRRRGWSVHAVADGRAALASAFARVPDLVLSDVMMPELDGFGLLRELRADPRTAGVPVVLLSARAGEESRVEGIEAGADDYLVKPFSARELLARVGANLELARMRRDVARFDAGSRAKSEFLTRMSHELRTPLNAALGYLELIDIGIHGPVNDAQRDALARIRRSQHHLLRLVTQVLDFSRIEAGHVDYHVTVFPVARVLAEVREMIEPQALAKRIAIDFSALPDGLTVRADEGKVQQILLNLLSNAVKFVAPSASVSVFIRLPAELSDPPMVALSVRDTGPGIPSERLEHVFEPFVQLDVSLTRRAEGTGLGLAISRDLARGMAGDLTAVSMLGEGSTFTLTLPGV